MDEVRAFFNNPLPSKSQVTKLRGTLTGGMCVSKKDTLDDLDRKAGHRRTAVPTGTDYVRQAREREIESYRYPIEQDYTASTEGGLESMERLTSIGTSMMNLKENVLTEEAMAEVYSKYSFQRKEDINNLAINDYKSDVLDALTKASIVIIEGPTGCGKTTQVPQWVLDDCYQKRLPCKVVVTQPRRIAAISIAKRVAQERGWDIGGLVGYQVGLENMSSMDSRITYVTTGILLQKLVAAKSMSEYTHVILDEVHERGQDMDFLLLVVKRLLYKVSPKTKVILMSATIKSDAFLDYFVVPVQGAVNAVSLKVAKNEPMFTVKTFYLEQLDKLHMLDQCISKTHEPSIMPEMHHLVLKLINAFEYMDKHEDNYEDINQADLPSVLVFLPGINEIEDLYNCLVDTKLRERLVGRDCAQYRWWVLPLHSTITADEQARVFTRAPLGQRKIILATNIAESSITVPDIKYVIDYCLMKTLVADEQTNFTSLQLSWASKANCEQRAGRAGRVRDGRVYRLVLSRDYNGFKDEATPEILRCPLERLVLLAKMLDIGPPSDTLALAMDPPDLSNIQRTMLVLKEIGALKKTLDDKWCSDDGDITYLGRVMAKLPLDVRVSKLIVLGYIFGCLDESIIMAAAMSAKNVFNNPFRERLNAYNSKLTWADGSTSDCIAFLNVYKVWNYLKRQNYFKAKGNSEVQWARQFYVQARALRETEDLVRELKLRLSREGIETTGASSPWAKHELPLAYKVIIAGAFYPQYFVQTSLHEDRERNAVKELGGLDPRNTVYLKNFPDNQPGEIYATAIKNAVRQHIGDEPKVTFDKNSRKVYLTFGDDNKVRREADSGDPTIPGQVVLPVYKSIKARQLKIDVRIPLLPVDRAQDLANALEMSKLNMKVETCVPRLPDIDETHFYLRICQFVSASKFWVHYDDESTASELRLINSTLNMSKLIVNTDSVAPGDMFAAPHADGVNLRARVIKLLPKDMVEVLYIDVGAYGRVSTHNLYVLPVALRTFLPLAMRCRLAGVAPAPLLEPHGDWTARALSAVKEMVSHSRLLGKVYSVVQGVVAIELLAKGGELNINQELIKRGYAVACEESYESKMNHDVRQTADELNLAQKRAYNKEQTQLAFTELREVEPPSPRDCISDVCLKGAYSPLETTPHALMYASREKRVVIEWNSVNSVLLDTDPQQTFQRLLVAVNVGQSESSSTLTLRHTTLMPNIPGLPAIIALLFCPTAELRRSASGSRYVSALCGLGGAVGGAPYFSEHDLLVDIDAEFTVDDVGWINHIRHLMDYMMYCNEGQTAPTPDDEARPKIPRIIREDLLKLVMSRRKRREVESVPFAWQWHSVPEDEVLEISEPDMVERAVVYPLHAPQELRPLSAEQLRAMHDDNEALKLLVARTPISSTAEHSCKLCGTGPLPTHTMRIHLYSNAHLEKEDDLRAFHS